MIKKTLQTIRKHDLLDRHMHIVIGLSGGPDSVCLFDVLYRLAEEMDWRLWAVHVNHKLRPGAAEEDQRYVEELCARRNVPCRVFTGDCNALSEQNKMTSEEAGRMLRYDSYAAVCDELQKAGVPKEKIAIALAHNANDQCETVLFRILRGSGTDGLAGIAYKRYDKNGRAIVRPILDISREEIERYCAERNLQPRIDHTNGENVYTRNRIRNMLIPYLAENFNAGITDTVNRLARVAACDRDYMRGESADAYEAARESGGADGEVLSVSMLRAFHKAIRTRVYSLALGRLGMEENITYNQLELIDDLTFSKSPSASADLSGGWQAAREYDRLIFTRPAGLSAASPAWAQSPATAQGSSPAAGPAAAQGSSPVAAQGSPSATAQVGCPSEVDDPSEVNHPAAVAGSGPAEAAGPAAAQVVCPSEVDDPSRVKCSAGAASPATAQVGCPAEVGCPSEVSHPAEAADTVASQGSTSAAGPAAAQSLSPVAGSVAAQGSSPAAGSAGTQSPVAGQGTTQVGCPSEVNHPAAVAGSDPAEAGCPSEVSHPAEAADTVASQGSTSAAGPATAQGSSPAAGPAGAQSPVAGQGSTQVGCSSEVNHPADADGSVTAQGSSPVAGSGPAEVSCPSEVDDSSEVNQPAEAADTVASQGSTSAAGPAAAQGSSPVAGSGPAEAGCPSEVSHPAEAADTVASQGSTSAASPVAGQGPAGAAGAAFTERGWRLVKMTGSQYAEYRESGKLHGAFGGLSPEEAACLEIRTRRAGDVLDVGNGRKKLQNFFVDEKLPRKYRDEALVLATGRQVLWVLPWDKYPGRTMREKGRFSAKYKALPKDGDFVIILEKL